MSDHRRQALDYFRVSPGAPWKWEEGGKVLVWSDGTTIAFREELSAIAERLAERGLPPFDAVALFLAACRGKIATLPTTSTSQHDFSKLVLARSQQQAGIALAKLGEVPSSWIKSPSGKAFLAEAIFESFSPTIPGGEIVAGLKYDFSDRELNTPAADAIPFDANATTLAVANGLQRHTLESLNQRHKTGLDALPRSADEISLPENERARRLLSELSRNAESAGLARVAREIMAAIRLPSPAADRDEFVFGGAAGLGNRGTLDRLLLSELAHDDLTLATRIALNEALYIHREPPILKPERSLAIVIDAGLRMWGIPRVIAVSAALALIARHRGTGAVTVSRPEGNALHAVDLLSQDGLLDHLAKLRTELDPRRALPALKASLTTENEIDTVLITHRDTLGDLAFQGHLTSLELSRGFLLLIDNDGLVELHPLPWGSPRPLSQVQIEVDSLVEAPTRKAKTKLVDPNLSTDLPAIFRESRFPLLLSAHTKMEKTARSKNGSLGVSTDRRFFRWFAGPFGAEQLLADLPSGRTCWMQEDEQGRYIIVKGRAKDGQMSVIIFDSRSLTRRTIRFVGPQNVAAVRIEHNALLLILYTRVVVVSLDTENILAEQNFQLGMQLISERYFSNGSGLHYVFWDGTSVCWDQCVAGRNRARSEIALAFDWDGIGAWILLKDGTLLTPTGTEYMKTGWPIGHARTTPNGAVLFAVQANDRTQRHIINLKLKRTIPLSAGQTWDSFNNFHFPSRPMQNRFNAIHRAPGEPLRLRKAKGDWLEIFPTPTALRLTKSIATEARLEKNLRSFIALPEMSSLGCSLELAEWPDGSKAWLDSRGLLHLRSHDSSVLELTLTLNQGDMAAWMSDGHRCGLPFFAGKDQPLTTEHAATILKVFCDRTC